MSLGPGDPPRRPTFSARLPATAVTPATPVTTVPAIGAAPGAGGTRLRGITFPGQCPVGQPAAAPALHQGGRQADIDNLEPPFRRPAVDRYHRSLPAGRPRRLRTPTGPQRRRPPPAIREVLCAAASHLGWLLGRLLGRLPGRLSRLSLLTRLLRQSLRLAPQFSQGQSGSSAHAGDDAARATSTIMSRADPHHARYPVPHLWKISRPDRHQLLVADSGKHPAILTAAAMVIMTAA